MNRAYVTERHLTDAIVDLAMTLGILVHHCRPSRQKDGSWRTPIQGHKGFPDLVLSGRRGTLIRELKSDTGRLALEQSRWLDNLERTGSDVGVWRVSDWPDRVTAELQAIR